MRDYKAPLDLNENYSFDVIVKDHDTNFAGKLILSPDECTLKVMSERQISSEFYNFDKIECFTLQNHFLLSDVQLKNWGFRSLRLNDPSDQGGFFELEFDVGFVIKANTSTSLKKETTFSGFSIEADMIRKWTGITKKQEDLLLQNSNGFFPSHADEDLKLFEIQLENIGFLYLAYNLNLHTDIDSMSSGVKLTPQLGVHFFECKDKYISILLKEIRKIYVLLSFFWGDDFSLNNLKITLPHIRGGDISGYYPSNYIANNKTYPIFPLGFDLRSRYNSYQGLPLDLFQEYYNLDNSKVEYFIKYLRYKRIKSNEEKFLGYFRILERLVHTTGTYVDEESLKILLDRSKKYLIKKLKSRSSDIRSLCKKIIKSNQGKYVTHDCISRFFDEIPEEIKITMSVKRSDIQGICKLRNDMTHANDYFVSEEDLYQYTEFIHQLLIFALVNKLLGVSLDVLTPLSNTFKFSKI
ncbi:HEPN domain-containing protein [Acinetobacter soli]|uniref:HEPN domain-containing protein n=1 Tax=Acinetobacter soli TaxID=487316 RepID=UPI001F3D2EFD|nr:HEPN domain-containing protein [Acinetobacter soli]MCE6007928.1 hypothetical protein [Acinetobacter soli]